MDMTGFASKLWHWLTDRSPRNAATPVVQPRSADYAPELGIPPASETIEVNVETECQSGSPVEVGEVKSLLKGPDGELVRTKKKMILIVGCNHAVSQFQAVDEKGRHIRGIAGPCYHCASRYQQELSKGRITAFDAARLSLVCSDCGKITSSGLLCCPKHYAAEANPDGTTTYLGPQEINRRQQQDTVRMILGPITSLLGKNAQDPPQTQQPEHDNGQETR
jgi:hypothetical protein